MTNPNGTNDVTEEAPKHNEPTDPGLKNKDIGQIVNSDRIAKLESSLKNTKRALLAALIAGGSLVTGILGKDKALSFALSDLDSKMDGIEESERAQVSEIALADKLQLDKATEESDAVKAAASAAAKSMLDEYTNTFEEKRLALIAAHDSSEAEITEEEKSKIAANASAKEEAIKAALSRIEAEYVEKAETIRTDAQTAQEENDKQLSSDLDALKETPTLIHNEETFTYEAEKFKIDDLTAKLNASAEAKIAEITGENKYAMTINWLLADALASASGWQRYQDSGTIGEMLNCSDGNNEAVVTVDCVDGLSVESGDKNIYVCEGVELPQVKGTNTIRVPGFKKVEADDICAVVDGVWATKLTPAN